MKDPGPRPCDACSEEYADRKIVDVQGRNLCPACRREFFKDLDEGSFVPCPPEFARRTRRRIAWLRVGGGALILLGVSWTILGPLLTFAPLRIHSPLCLLLLFYALQMIFPAGLVLYLRSKGRHVWWGVLGALYCVAIPIAFFLSKYCRYCHARGNFHVTSCRRCNCPM
jgi:hypothetical protein